MRPVSQLRVVLPAIELLHERVPRVDLQHGLDGQPGALQSAREVDVDLGLVGHDAGRGGGQAGRHAHVPGLTREQVFQLGQQTGEVGAGLLVSSLLRLIRQRDEIGTALRYRLESFPVEVAEAGDDPVVDRFPEEQDLDALGAEGLQVRAAGRGGQRRSDQVIDLLLTVLHASHVVAERDAGAPDTRGGCREAEQPRDVLPVVVVVGYPLLQDGAELLPEDGVLIRVVVGHLLEQLENPLDGSGPDSVYHAAALQHFPRDVERQVTRVDYTPDEAQITRDQLAIAVFQDENSPHMQPDATRRVLYPQVVWRASRNEQQQRVLILTFDLAMHPGQRLGEIVADVPVEGAVVLVADLTFRAHPERRGLIDDRVLDLLAAMVSRVPGLFGRHHDRQADVI